MTDTAKRTTEARNLKVGDLIKVAGETCPVTYIRKHRTYTGYLAVQYATGMHTGQIAAKPSDLIQLAEENEQ